MSCPESRPRVDIAIGALVADGCFCLAFMLHLANRNGDAVSLQEFLVMGFILSVLLSCCWVIYDDYWLARGEKAVRVPVKTLRIRELKQGAALEFDGKSYRVDKIDRASGEILLARVGQPGNIVVQIENEQ